ncbi:MAG: PKD domain-containing protein [Chitinivibrionales bacterium]|nr:PKD domain-containing protein [Chitinivibrionales bacterium]
MKTIASAIKIYRVIVLVLLVVGIQTSYAFMTVDATSNAGVLYEDVKFGWNHTIGNGVNRLLVFSISGAQWDNNNTNAARIDSIKFNNKKAIYAASSYYGTNSLCSQIWYMLEDSLPAAGTYRCSVFFKGEFDPGSAGAISFFGAAQQAPEAEDSTTLTSGTNILTDVTTITDGAWLVDALFVNGGDDPAPTESGQQEMWDITNWGIYHSAASRRQIGTAGNAGMGWTSAPASQNGWAHVVCAFAPDNSPGGTITIQDNNGYTNDNTPLITVVHANANQMAITLDTNSYSFIPVASTYNGITFTSEGKNIVWTKFTDGSNPSAWVKDSTIYDITPPTSAIITSGSFIPDTWHPHDSVKGTMSDGSGEVAGGDSVKITIKAPGTGNRYWDGSAWLSTETWLKATLASGVWSYEIDTASLNEGGSGTYTISSLAYDKAGNVQSSSGTGSFSYDAPGPENPSISVEDGNGYSNTTTISCHLSADQATGVKVLEGSNSQNPPAGGSYVAFSDPQLQNVTVGSTGGWKYLWSRFRDSQGYESYWVVDSTFYDGTPPNSDISTTGGFNASSWGDSIKGSATDAAPQSGIASVKISIFNQSTSQNWNGSGWQFAEGDTIWLSVTGTTSWEYELLDAGLVDGTCLIQSRAEDNAGNLQIVLDTTYITYDNTPPSGSVTISDNNGYTNDADPPLTITSSNADNMRLAFGADTTTWKVYATPDSIPVAAGGDGPVSVYAQFKDAVGNVSGWVSDNTIYDGADPQSAITTTSTYNSGAWPGAVSGTAADSTSGVEQVLVQVERVSPPGYWTGSGWGSAGFLSATLTFGAANSWNWSLNIPVGSLSNGQYNITCKAVDSSGNEQATATAASFAYDSSGPAGAQIAIIDSSGFTADPTPPLSLYATDVVEMRIGLAASDTISWKNYSTTDSIDISGVGSGNGARIYVQYRDANDNRSIWISDSTTYDITPPSAIITTAGTFNSTSWSGRIQGSSSDNAAGVSLIEVSIQSQLNSTWWDGSAWTASATPIWLPATGAGSWYYPLAASNLTDGVFSVWARGIDRVGNLQSSLAAGDITYDNTPPLNPEILITDQNGYTRDTDPYLRLTASGADSMRIALSQNPLAVWKPWNSADSITISSGGDGAKIIYAQFKDSVGNVGAWASDTTTFDITPPTSLVITPAPASVMNPSAWIDTVKGTASDPTAGIQSVRISIQSRVSGRFWNGNAWVDGDSLWLSATGTVSWHYPINDNQFTDTAYTVASRAVDSAGNVQQIPAKNHFLFYQPPVAGFDARGSALRATAVQFTDTSKGAITGYLWDFGDGNTSTEQNPTHVYQTAGSYLVGLIVDGPGGKDTAFLTDSLLVYEEDQNPIRLDGQYINDTTVALSFEGHSDISTSLFEPPSADSIQLWIRPNALPTDQNLGTQLTKYSVSNLQNRGDPAFDTVTVPQLASGDTAYGFMTSVEWIHGHPSGFRSINGDLVVMEDTTRPVNDLIMTGTYLGGDSIRLTLDSISSIDTQYVARIGIWYGLSQTGDFSDTSSTRWYDVSTIIAGTVADTWSVTLSDPLFAGESRTLYVRAVLEGKNLLYSEDSAKADFTVGNPRPDNPVVLRATALNSETIRLSWSEISGVDSIKIWYGTQEIPEDPPGALTLMTLVPGATDTVDTAEGLNANTRYRFGLQIRKNGLWSLVTQNSSATDSTPAADTGSIVNSIDIVDARFDTSVNQIIITWRVDHYDNIDRRYGIHLDTSFCSLDTPAVWLPVTDTFNVDSIEFNHDELVFDALYCISMWLKRSGGAPSLPTDSSRKTLETPSYTWQSVTYFTRDTVKLFNRNVRLWKDSTYTIPPTTDIIYNYSPDTALLKGLDPVGVGMYFKNPQPSQPFYLGFAYDSIPSGYTAGDIRLYRFIGTEYVVERNTVLDTSLDLIYIKTNALYSNDLKIPLIPMIDTASPEITFESETTTVVDMAVQSTISDTFILGDNVGNARWRLYYAKGGESIDKPAPDSSGILSSTSDTIVSFIDSRGTEDNGMRILLVVDDGVHVDTVNLSRQTVRPLSDPLATEAMEWYPVHTTATPESASVAFMMRNTVQSGASWSYNRKRARIFRWFPCEDNRYDNEKWIEYSDKYDSLGYFDCLPGRLIWIKTKENESVDFGKAVTLSLKDTFNLELPPNEWTDCAIPFKFDMRISDILAATGSRADSCEFYRWEQGGGPEGDIFLSEALYVPGLIGSDTMTIVSGDAAGHTVYNRADTMVTLKFPPVPLSMSTVPQSETTFLARRKKTSEWRIRLVPRVKGMGKITSVYCGYSPGEGMVTYYRKPPSHGNISVSIYDKAGGRQYGHSLVHRLEGNGAVFPLLFSNDSEHKKQITAHYEILSSTPENYRIKLFDPATKTWVDDSADCKTIVSGGAKEYRYLVVGDNTFLQQFKTGFKTWNLALVNTFPNPFRNTITILYSLPYSGIRELHFSIFDMLGRTVWDLKIPSRSMRPGLNRITWNGLNRTGDKIASGTYMLRMTAVDNKQETRLFKRRLTYVK